MICVACKKMVDENVPFVGVYADVGKWTIHADSDEYDVETSKYLAVCHLTCIQNASTDLFLEAAHREFPEFQQRAIKVLKKLNAKKKNTKLSLIKGGRR